jgi:hypothetical protein
VRFALKKRARENAFFFYLQSLPPDDSSVSLSLFLSLSGDSGPRLADVWKMPHLFGNNNNINNNNHKNNEKLLTEMRKRSSKTHFLDASPSAVVSLPDFESDEPFKV